MVSNVALVAVSALVGISAQQASSDAGSVVGGFFAVLMWLAILGGLLYWLISNRQPYQVEVATSMTTQEAVNTAVQTFTMAGWSVTSSTTESATLRVQGRGRSCLLAAILLVIGIIPGILYLAFAGRDINVSVYARRAGSSSTTVKIGVSARGWGGKSDADRVAAALQPSGRYGPQSATG